MRSELEEHSSEGRRLIHYNCTAKVRDNVPNTIDICHTESNSIEEKSYCRKHESSTYNFQYAHLTDGLRLMTIDHWLWWHIQSYVEYYPIKYAYFRCQSMRLAIQCREAVIHTSRLAVLSPIPTTIQQTKSIAMWQRLQCHICCKVILPRILSEYDLNSNWAIPSYPSPMSIDNCKLTSQIQPFQSMFPMKPYEISCRWSNDFRRGGWLYWNLKQPWTQTITVREAEEWSTLRSIHRLRTIAVPTAPEHESSSGLREW